MALNWPGLFKWSMEFQDGTEDRNVQPMSPERREFLENALQEFLKSVKDIHQVCKTALEKMDPNDTDATLASLRVVAELLDEWPELARDFTKLQAHKPLIQCALLNDNCNQPVVMEALKVLAGSLQNNPPFQDMVIDDNGLVKICTVLLHNEKTGSDSPEVTEMRNKVRYLAMTCLSCMVRCNSRAEEKFVKEGGVAWIRHAICSKELKYATRALILLYHLLSNSAIPNAAATGLISPLLRLIDSLDVDTTCETGEYTLDVIHSFMEHYNQINDVQILEKLENRLNDWKDRIDTEEGRDCHSVEIDKIIEILNKIKNNEEQ